MPISRFLARTHIVRIRKGTASAPAAIITASTVGQLLLIVRQRAGCGLIVVIVAFQAIVAPVHRIVCQDLFLYGIQHQRVFHEQGHFTITRSLHGPARHCRNGIVFNLRPMPHVGVCEDNIGKDIVLGSPVRQILFEIDPKNPDDLRDSNAVPYCSPVIKSKL